MGGVVTGRALREAAGGPADLSHAALSQPVGAHQPRKFKLLDLFSGIGGFSLGLERTGGFETVAFCETAERPSQILTRHWPHVPNLGDVTTAEFPDADVVSAGFPCQDLSYAGFGAGLSGSRSGLWREVVRAVRVARPLYVVLENVGALLARGLDKVLRDMAALGYDAEWHCIPSAALGSPDRRDRAWIVGYATADAPVLFGEAQLRREQDRAVSGHWRDGWRATAEKLRDVDDGVSGRVDGLSALANAVKPQFPELIGRAILEHYRQPLHNPSAHLSHPQHASASGKGFVFNHGSASK